MPCVLRLKDQLTRPRAGTMLASAALLVSGVIAAACGTAGRAVRRRPFALRARSASSRRALAACCRRPLRRPRRPRPGRGPPPRRPRRPRTGRAVAGPAVPGAPGCPLFPADNVWNTDISALPVAPQSAAWLASMDAAGTDLHPDFGPDQGGYPYGIPVTVVTAGHPLAAVSFTYGDESDRGPYPFGPTP